MAKKYYTVAEVSEAIGVCCPTVINWIKTGNLKAAINNDSKTYLIKQEDLKAFIVNPPGPRVRGIVALVDKTIIRQLIGEKKTKKQYKWGGYDRSVKPIGWILPSNGANY